MSAVRAPQSKPATIAFSIPSASISAMASTASAACSPLRNVSSEQEARRAVAAQVRDDHPVARGGQQRGDVDVAVDVVRPAVQQEDRRPVGRAGVGVADVEDAGVDLPDGPECRGVVTPWLESRRSPQ